MDALAGALEVQIKELFEFEHMVEENVTVRNIEEMLRGAGEEKLRVIYRVVKAILRYQPSVSPAGIRDTCLSSTH